MLKKIEASTVMNLNNPIEMSKLRKRMIKKAADKGITVGEELAKQNYVEYMSLLDGVLMKHHDLHPVHTADEMFLLHSRFPDNIRLITARCSGELLAGTILYEYDNVIHTQYLAVADEARNTGALDLVVSYVIDKYRNRKSFLDFGISTEKAGHYLNEGLISQKEGFGGRTVVYKTWYLKG